jgi:hypothetical protein
MAIIVTWAQEEDQDKSLLTVKAQLEPRKVERECLGRYA